MQKPSNISLQIGFRIQEKSSVRIREKTAEELSHEWANKEMRLPRLVFLFINFYEFCLPIFFLIGVGYGLHILLDFFNLAIIYRILLAGFYLPLFYAAYIWSMANLCHWLNIYFERKSPPREGVFSRKFNGNNVANPEVHYYHLRGFLYKWPVFLAKKSLFPWMQNYVLRKVGGNIIHRDAQYGDCFVGLEFTKIYNDVVIMDGSTISSHVVDSIFGSLSLETILLGKNSTLHSNIVVAPGAAVSPTRSIGPKAFLPKRWHEKMPAQFQWGDPVPVGKGNRSSFLEILPERFQNQWEEKKKTSSV